MAGPFRLVVARWQEDISWTDRLPDWELLIVQKDRDLPNTGREPASFLWAMEQLYNKRGRIAFLQGNPFDHCQNLTERINHPGAFVWLGDPGLQTEADGSPHHTGLPVAGKLGEWCGQEWTGPVSFAAGGQFAIDARQLRKWPKSKYTDLRREMSIDQNCWVMERLWERFLG